MLASDFAVGKLVAELGTDAGGQLGMHSDSESCVLSIRQHALFGVTSEMLTVSQCCETVPSLLRPDPIFPLR